MINLQQIADKLDFDIDDVSMLMEIFLDNASESLEIFNAALRTNNYEQIKNATHAIAGSASNLMLEDITNIAKRIELLAKKEKNVDYKSLYLELKYELDLLTQFEEVL